MAEKKNHWIKGIDSIRFFLALIVLLSHIQDPFVLALKNVSSRPVQLLGITINHLFFGVGAVIAFFVISGFVIHYPNRNKERFNITEFLLRRWLRIGIPFLVVGVVAGLFNYFDRIPAWSLYCELIYYTLYPLLFKIRISWKRKFQFSFLISLIVIVAFGKDSFFSLIHQQNLHYGINYWQLGVSLTWLIGLPCWLLGVLLAEKIDKIRYSVSLKEIFAWRVIVFGCSMILFSLAAHYFLSCLFSLNFFALLLYKWIEKEIVYYRSHGASRVFEYFGKFSYSLYLSHELCFILLSLFMTDNVYTYFLFIGLTVFMSYIVYLLVEYPSHKFARFIGNRFAAKTKVATTGT